MDNEFKSLAMFFLLQCKPSSSEVKLCYLLICGCGCWLGSSETETHRSGFLSSSCLTLFCPLIPYLSPLFLVARSIVLVPLSSHLHLTRINLANILPSNSSSLCLLSVVHAQCQTAAVPFHEAVESGWAREDPAQQGGDGEMGRVSGRHSRQQR